MSLELAVIKGKISGKSEKVYYLVEQDVCVLTKNPCERMKLKEFNYCRQCAWAQKYEIKNDKSIK